MVEYLILDTLICDLNLIWPGCCFAPKPYGMFLVCLCMFTSYNLRDANKNPKNTKHLKSPAPQMPQY